jgi:hypothetical protein
MKTFWELGENTLRIPKQGKKYNLKKKNHLEMNF